MSPASRGPQRKKGNRSTARRPIAAVPVASCDCPACTVRADLATFVDKVLADAAEVANPLEAEVTAAAFVTTCELAGSGFEDLLADGFVPAFEARADTAALTILLAIGAVCDGRIGTAATAAAGRLTDAGVVPPTWAAELAQPPTVGDCWRLTDRDGSGSTLVASFHRPTAPHALTVSVDHTDAGAAATITLRNPADVPRALVRSRTGPIVKERLDPAEFRWQAECALDARAWRDAEAGEEFAGVGPSQYYPLARLLRTRLRSLPDSGKPKPHPA